VQVAKVIKGLHSYFHVSSQAGRRMVSMPSQVVDVAWHECILFTHDYQAFCRKALGRFLHHVPAEAMHSPTVAQQGIKHVWRLSCLLEGISPQSPDRLPLLFALDAELEFPDEFRYSLDCTKGGHRGNSFCGSHVGCSSCGGDTGCGSDSGRGGGGGGD
jgi:hypothetical protein